MKNGLIDAWKNFLSLLRFLVWYVIALAAVIYFLPIAGLFLEDRYDTMSSSVKLYSILGFFTAIALWQFLTWKNRLKVSGEQEKTSSARDPAE